MSEPEGTSPGAFPEAQNLPASDTATSAADPAGQRVDVGTDQGVQVQHEASPAPALPDETSYPDHDTWARDVIARLWDKVHGHG